MWYFQQGGSVLNTAASQVSFCSTLSYAIILKMCTVEHSYQVHRLGSTQHEPCSA